ncbi:MAG: DNA repair protein RecN [Deltaproteobacteria bacterium]|jgi:DNA repair protein RecN (Recombination protein N)|nr:DNA repair protein RecN [Deltaproteobacteria bacterium]
MLQELTIRNFAIIDDLHIQFSEGLTIISGETGAGKSIILNAVNLLLGSRASAELVRTGAESAELEALFQVAPSSRVARQMADHDFDTANGLIVRRIISRSDTNRVYINGRLATIQVLNSITEDLASISGQHAHQGLLKEDQHLLVLDQSGGLMPLRREVGNDYNEILPLIERRKELQRIKTRQAEQFELLRFQQNEITQTAILPDEDKELEREHTRLKNAEALYQTISDSIDELYNASGSVIERLLEVKKSLDKVSQIDSQLKTSAESLADSSYQIEDLVDGLRRYLTSIVPDERRLEAVEERLDTLNKLKRKYGGSIEAVFTKLQEIEKELMRVENIDAQITEVETDLAEKHSRLALACLKLSRKRKKVAAGLAKKVIGELETLKMSATDFQVLLQTIPADDKTDPSLSTENCMINESGIDRATFLLAPNVGEELKPLTSIASGGELSRVVLALKAILAQTDSVETVVFDEVDAGIGGGVAEVVGSKLSRLARHHQVLCITHLPQIAKFADRHYRVSKHISKGRTRTEITALDSEERRNEIARMLGGEKITAATMEHAKELLKK